MDDILGKRKKRNPPLADSYGETLRIPTGGRNIKLIIDYLVAGGENGEAGGYKSENSR